jgi:hypothetical protein
MTALTDERYLVLMGRLASASAEHAARRARAEREYAQRCAGAAAAVQQAEQRVAGAAAAVRAASELVEQVDAAAAELWGDVRLRADTGGRRTVRVGGLPEPAGEPALSELDGVPEVSTVDSVGSLLGDAAELLERSRRREPLAGAAYPVLALLGVAGTAAAYAAARAVLYAAHLVAGPTGLVLTVAGQISVFLAPLAGLVLARWYVDRSGARFDVAVFGAVLLGGMLTECALGVLLTS